MLYNWFKLWVNSIYVLVHVLGGNNMNEIVNIISTEGNN